MKIKLQLEECLKLSSFCIIDNYSLYIPCTYDNVLCSDRKTIPGFISEEYELISNSLRCCSHIVCFRDSIFLVIFQHFMNILYHYSDPNLAEQCIACWTGTADCGNSSRISIAIRLHRCTHWFHRQLSALLHLAVHFPHQVAAKDNVEMDLCKRPWSNYARCCRRYNGYDSYHFGNCEDVRIASPVTPSSLAPRCIVFLLLIRID